MKPFSLLLIFLPALLPAASPPPWLELPAAGEPHPMGVSAWILHDSMVVTQENASTVVYRHRQAVMPLSEAGVKNTACAIEFTSGTEELVSARAWAMSPDGKKCRALGGDEFLVYSPTYLNSFIWDLSKMVYLKPERYLEPGWIFAWEVEIRSSTGRFDTRWSPEGSLPVRTSTLEIVPVRGGEVKWKDFSGGLPPPTAGSAPGALVWRLANVPASPLDIPDGLEWSGRQLGAYVLTPKAKAANSKSWAEVVRLVRAEMDPKSASSPAIDTEARRLAATGSLWDRIRPVCTFVQKEVVYLEVAIETDSMAGYRPHAATEVFANRYGDCKDKAVLLCTMLHSVGVEARVMLVNSGYPTVNVVDWPSARFNHAIVAIRATEPVPPGWTAIKAENEDYVLFDPTNDRIPFGLLPLYDTGGLGLVLSADVTGPNQIPAVAAPGELRSVEIAAKLTDDGSAAIDVVEKCSGLAAAEAITMDETVPRTDRTGELEKRIQRRMPLIADLKWESSGDAQNHRWERQAHFSAQYVSKRIPGGGQYVATDLLSVVPYLSPWEQGTEGRFNFAGGSMSRVIRLSLPPGWEFSELPPDWSLKTEAGESVMNYRHEGGTVVGRMQLRVAGGVLDRPAYLATRSLLQAITMAERRPVILRRLATAPAAASPAPPVAAQPK